MELLGLWLCLDLCDEVFGAYVHVDVTLDVLRCIIIVKVGCFISMPFDFAEDERDRASSNDALHFHFKVDISFCHSRIRGCVERVVSEGLIIVTEESNHGVFEGK